MPRSAAASERTCIVTREVKSADELIRFVVAPDGTVVADLKRRLPGRGVWVTADAGMVRTAEKRKLFTKVFEGEVSVSPGLAERVDALLLSAATGALALARKAGGLVGGFGKVEAALASDPVIALVHAAEAGQDGVAKLAAAARRRFKESAIPVIRTFGADQLDLAFGRTNVIHAALLAGPAGANVLARVGDLVRFRGVDIPPSGEIGRSFDASTDVNDLSAGP